MTRRLTESPESRSLPKVSRSLESKRFSRFFGGTLALAFLAAGCASPDKLSRQSQEKLQQGHADEAYEKARDALDKEPDFAPARTAMMAAAAQLRLEHAQILDSLAAKGDSSRAADEALRWDVFARQFTAHHAELPADSALAQRERRVRIAAAADYYARADFTSREGRAKEAYMLFQRAERYWGAYRDVSERVHETYEDAQVTVAVLPFANQTDAPGLSRSLDQDFYGLVDDHVHSRNLKFTRLLPQEDVANTVTLSELDQMSRDEAIRIGRRLHVDQVLWGRYHSLTSHDEIRDTRFPVYHKEVTHNPKGPDTERYVESAMDVLERERNVTIHYDIELVDTRTRALVDRQTDAVQSNASVAFSRFEPLEDYDDYCLVPPQYASDAQSAPKKAEKQWKARMGDWALPDFLKTAHQEQRRAHYSPNYLREFRSRRDRPVFLGELPPVEDLAAVALSEAWKPAVKMLEEQDRK